MAKTIDEFNHIENYLNQLSGFLGAECVLGNFKHGETIRVNLPPGTRQITNTGDQILIYSEPFLFKLVIKF